MLMHYVDLRAALQALSQHVDKIGVRVEEGGVGRHVVPVPCIYDSGNYLIDFSCGSDLIYRCDSFVHNMLTHSALVE